MKELIERLEAATGPDRELDLAIHVALWPEGDIAKVIKHRRGFDHEEGMAWDIHHGSVCFEKWTPQGQCTYNGGYPLPAYCASIDAAVSLVPEGFKWRLGYSRHVPCVADLIDWRDPGNYFLVGAHYAECDSNHAIALTIAALKARFALSPVSKGEA